MLNGYSTVRTILTTNKTGIVYVGTKPILLFTFQKIAGDLRSRVPFEAIVPSEKIIFPSKGEDSGK